MRIRTLLTLLSVIVFSFDFSAQCSGGGASLASTDFETSYTGNAGWGIDYVSSVGDCVMGTDVFGIVNTSGGAWNGLTANGGDQMWGFQDVEGNCGSAAGETLTFTYTVPGGAAYTEVEICFDYTVFEFDGGDDIVADIAVNGTSPCAEVMDQLIVDGNSNLTVPWTTQCYVITVAPGDVVTLELLVDQNGGGDYGAFDNVNICEAASGATNSCPVSSCPNAGDLMITEIMYDADGTDTGAEWVEVCNTTAADIDMMDFVLSNSGATDHTVSGSLVVSAGQCIILATGMLGCGAAATPDYVFSGFSLGNTADEFEILCGGNSIDVVSWDEAAGWPIPNGGESIQFDLDATQNSTENDDPANWCASSTVCGGGTGTPGVTNTSCNLCMTPTASGSTATTSFTTGATNSSGDVDVLDDACVAAQGAANCASGETFIPTYGTLSWDGTVGSITGLETTDGIAYTGTSTFDVFEIIQACKGTGEMGAALTTHSTNTTVSSSTTSMQGDSPKPTGIGGHFTENGGSSSDVNQVCFDFSVPVDFVSFFIGDVESSDVNPGYIHVYDASGDLITSDQIPTVTPLGDQATDCTGGTGSAGFDGCGNDETVFVKIESPTLSIAKICIEVGDFTDDLASPAGTEHISFGGVSIGGTCALLPVSWTYFDAYQFRTKADLEWGTAQEINNEVFEVEWSQDGKSFRKIGEVQGAGNSNFENLYRFTHENPLSGDNYYRIKQIDYNGNFEYSVIKVVHFTDDLIVQIRPESFDQIVYIELFDDQGAQFELYNLAGQLIKSLVVNSSIELDLAELQSGVYVARLNVGNKTIVKRLVKK